MIRSSREIHLARAEATLFAVDQGSGPPLVFFHGGLADHRAALLHVGSLADRLRVITPDLRGAGRSRWARDLAWRLLADDACALVRHLGLDRVVVGGVSMGSGVALATAIAHPDAVSGVILVHPVYPGTGRALADAPRQALDAMDAVARRAPTEGIQVLYPLFDALPAEIRVRARAMLDSFDPGSVAATTRLLASGVQPYAGEELAGVACPVLIVPGVDPSHPAEVGEQLAVDLPQATVGTGDEILGFCLARG